MRVFWEFVRADIKDNGNVISKEIGSDLKDPVISSLLVDIRTQLLKVRFLLRLPIFMFTHLHPFHCVYVCISLRFYKFSFK
jgi:hypothetical protein